LLTLPSNAAILVIDVQEGFDDPQWGSRNNPDAEKVIASMLGVWRETSRPVLHVQHLSKFEGSPLHPANAGCKIKEEVQPFQGEMVFQKRVNSAFIGTSLEENLRDQGIDTIVMVGLTTPHCVSTSARMAATLGFHVYLAKDAIAAFGITGPDGKNHSAEEIHQISLATLHDEFATITDSRTLIDAALS